MRYSKKSQNLDNVKWILTLLMVMYHIPNIAEAGGNNTLFLFIESFADCVVDAFALISGFLFWRSVNSFEIVKVKMGKRIKTLLIPYLLWNFLHTFFLKCFNVISWEINPIDNLLKWQQTPHFWYIFMLMFYTLLAPALHVIYRDKRLIILLLLSQAIYLMYKGENILHSRYIYIYCILGEVYLEYISKIYLKK